jgi:hypothetical protein
MAKGLRLSEIWSGTLMNDLLTSGFTNAPYWWDAAPLTAVAG